MLEEGLGFGCIFCSKKVWDSASGTVGMLLPSEAELVMMSVLTEEGVETGLKLLLGDSR